ncbi:acetyl-CoA acetyltransferase [Methylobacterium fujisawaense]|uniref:acetyl-CoA C-acetyltransferase n=1 Tax=Methylobacterium fujisawaense TaxID=107400 RepID=UPI002F2F2799
MPECFIYDHLRTPRGRGRPDGALHEVPPIDLASAVLVGLRDRNGVDTSLVDDVVLGCVEPVGEQSNNVGRLAAINAGYSENVPGVQINRFCASGLDAVNMAAAQVMSGQSDLVVGGGVESMSRVPMFSGGGGAWMVDPAVAFKGYFAPQGIGADLIATRWGFRREEVDGYAIESQRRAAAAWSDGRFQRSILPICDELGQVLLGTDEHMRPTATMQSLGALKPAFDKLGESGFDAVALQRYPDMEWIEHVHHAGNSSGIVDGAAAVLVGSREAGEGMGLKPRARIRAFGSIGSEPCIMLTGPEIVTRKVLKRAGMEPADIDLFELNEAFASVVLLYRQLLDLDPAILNVNGGSIAMGHPLGATGAMILGIVLDELERRDLTTALVTLCVGAGMGTATIIERV